MVYGSEAVLPADLKFGAPRLIFESIAEVEATRLEDVDVLEEERLNAVIQSARYQQTLRRYHDNAVRQRFFSVGDLVLCRILTGEGRHKLSPFWEGPFIVAEVTRPGSYRLTQMDGTEVAKISTFHLSLIKVSVVSTGQAGKASLISCNIYSHSFSSLRCV